MKNLTENFKKKNMFFLLFFCCCTCTKVKVVVTGFVISFSFICIFISAGFSKSESNFDIYFASIRD